MDSKEKLESLKISSKYLTEDDDDKFIEEAIEEYHHQVQILNIGKTGKNEKPYEIIQDEEGCAIVKFGAGKDKVMEAILENNPDQLKRALQDPEHYHVANLLRSGETAPMVVACDRGYTKCVQVLLLKGIDPLSIDAEGRTGIHLASRKAHIDILQLIFDSADGDMGLIYEFANHMCFDRQQTPLHYAASSLVPADKKVRVVQFLLMNEAFARNQDSNGDFPSSLCADDSVLSVLDTAERLCLSREQYYRLYHPSYTLHDKEDEDNGAEDNEEHLGDKEDSEEHMRDAEDNDGHVIDTSKGPFVLCRDDEIDFLYLRLKSDSHKDSVMEAVLKGNPGDLLKALGEAKEAKYLMTIDMHREGQCYPPLVEATIYDHQQCVKHLLDYGADVLACDPNYVTAIHAASHFARMEILRMLFHTVEGDKRLTWRLANHCTMAGKTPLHYAVKAVSKSNEVVNFLLQNGADPRYADRDMMRPSAFCVDSGTQDMLLRTEKEYDKGKRLGV